MADASVPADEPHHMMDWIKTKYLDQKEQDYVMRVFIFQCNNLPPADSNGLADP